MNFRTSAIQTVNYVDALMIPQYFLIFQLFWQLLCPWLWLLSHLLWYPSYIGTHILFFFFQIIYKTSILQRSDVHPNLASKNYCPIYRKRSTSKFMRTICCQAPRYSLDNVSKMLPPMNALDSYFGKWNGTNMWQIKSVSPDTDHRIFIKLVQRSSIYILLRISCCFCCCCCCQPQDQIHPYQNCSEAAVFQPFGRH